MNRTIKTVTLGMTLLLAATPAIAGSIGQRQVNQQKRIHQGVRSGELTRREARCLEKQQLRIRHEKHDARRDGVITRRERARIHHHQNRASRHLFRQKHDGQHR